LEKTKTNNDISIIDEDLQTRIWGTQWLLTSFFFKIMEDYLGVPLHIKVEEADLVDVIVKEVSLWIG